MSVEVVAIHYRNIYREVFPFPMTDEHVAAAVAGCLEAAILEEPFPLRVERVERVGASFTVVTPAGTTYRVSVEVL